MPAEAGETSITVPINGDVLDEQDETLFVDLSPVTGGNSTVDGSNNSAQGTILDDDSPSASISDVAVTEGDAGNVNATFRVDLAAASVQTIYIDYRTSNVNAVAGSDYVFQSGRLTFPIGSTTQFINIPVVGDTIDEVDETFRVTIFTDTFNTVNNGSTGSNPTLGVNFTNLGNGNGVGLGTILDDDTPPSISFVQDKTVNEPDAGQQTSVTFDVILSGPSGKSVSVDYKTTPGTATGGPLAAAGTDYQTVGTTTLAFSPGQTTRQITIQVFGDNTDETDESFFVDLSNPVNATLVDNQAQATIYDNDGPFITVTDVTANEGNSGSSNFQFNVQLSAASPQTILVDVKTADGSAISTGANPDYSPVTRTLTFAPGETVKQVDVPVNGDLANEPNEFFTVNLSNVLNDPQSVSPNLPATIGDGQGIGTILNDDSQPVISITNSQVTEGNSGTVNATFTVSLSATSFQTITVNYATGDNEATLADQDYVQTSGSLTFSPNTATPKTITVPVRGDTKDETNETFRVVLTNPNNATINSAPGGDTGTGTIVDDDSPTVNMSAPAPFVEGDTGANTAVFTVTLSAPSPETITLTYTTQNGSATSPSDYTATSGTVTFVPNDVSETISVPIITDLLNENNETFRVQLTNTDPGKVVSGTLLATATITNDDATPTVFFQPVTVSVTEGNGGATTNAVFTVKLSAASGKTVTVNYTTNDGSATVADNDYQAVNGTLTFVPGDDTETITVPIKGDNIFELNETFTVDLSGPVSATLGAATATGTINNDDAAPSIGVSDVTVNEGAPLTTTNAVFTVTLSTASSQPITVDVGTADGTALNPTDYTSLNQTVTFAPGVTSQLVSVSVIGDSMDEPNETFVLNLTNAVNATIADNQGRGTITDDDNVPTISINNATVTEGDATTVTATFTVSLSQASGKTVTVKYATANNTATSPADYTAVTSTQISFAPGQTTQTVPVQVQGDVLDENNETFFVNLSTPVNATLGTSQGQGTITDNDALPGFSISNVSKPEGNTGTTPFVFTVNLSAPSGRSTKVNYTTANGTATAPSDYTTQTGTLVFAAGVTSKTVTVLVQGDTVSEANETFSVTLSSPVSATILVGQDQATGTIQDNDATPSLTITDVTVTEGNTGTTDAVFTVTLAAPSGQAITVDYATADASAKAPSDYTQTNNTLTFAPGVLTQTISVPVQGDLLDEADETFSVKLSNAVKATIAKTTGTATITDDDAPPSLSIADATVNEGDTSTTPLPFTVTLSAPSGLDVTVSYRTSDSTAVAPKDYVAAGPTTLTIPAGQTTTTIPVTVNGDTINEADETLLVDLTSPVNATLTNSRATGTIKDDDIVPSITISDVSQDEGTGVPTAFVFDVTLSAPSEQTVTVNYALHDGTATTPADYAAATGTVTFLPLETAKTFSVTWPAITMTKTTKRLWSILTGAAKATIAKAAGNATIVDDDALPQLSIGNARVQEGDDPTKTVDAVFTVRLNPASARAVSVAYSTAPGGTFPATQGGTAPSDYSGVSGVLNFPAGATTLTIAVPVRGDTLDEEDETFFVNLSGATNATISNGQGVGTIADDDKGPSLVVNDATVVEGNLDGSGQPTITPLAFTVTLNGNTTRTIIVDYQTNQIAPPNNATSDVDFTAKNGTLTFTPGQRTKTVVIDILGDLQLEPDERFAINLTLRSADTSFAAAGDDQGIGTITNDDISPPSINGANPFDPDFGFPPFTKTPIGTQVTINGNGFDGTSQVFFNGVRATKVTVNSLTSITAEVPVGASSGRIVVTTIRGTATSNADFLVEPTVNSFTPDRGVGGVTQVTIAGSNFQDARNPAVGVKFGGVSVPSSSITFVSDTQIIVTVPLGIAPGNYPIIVVAENSGDGPPSVDQFKVKRVTPGGITFHSPPNYNDPIPTYSLPENADIPANSIFRTLRLFAAKQVDPQFNDPEVAPVRNIIAQITVDSTNSNSGSPLIVVENLKTGIVTSASTNVSVTFPSGDLTTAYRVSLVYTGDDSAQDTQQIRLRATIINNNNDPYYPANGTNSTTPTITDSRFDLHGFSVDTTTVLRTSELGDSDPNGKGVTKFLHLPPTTLISLIHSGQMSFSSETSIPAIPSEVSRVAASDS